MDSIIHGLEIIGGIGLALFGVFYTSHKQVAIWIFFASGVIFLLALTLFWQQKSISKPQFKAGISGSININSIPSPLVLLYDKHSYDEKTHGQSIAEISNAIHLDLTNINNIPVKLRSYQIRALFEYDEGGTVDLIKVGSGVRPIYKPSGKSVRKWRNLYSIGPLTDQIYFVTDWKKAQRFGLNKYGFDNIALKTKQLNPGESLSGWLLFEVDEDLRYQNFKIIEYEAILTAATGETSVKFKSLPENETTEFVSGGSIDMLELVDLTKIKWDICALISLKRAASGKENLVTIDLSDIGKKIDNR